MKITGKAYQKKQMARINVNYVANTTQNER